MHADHLKRPELMTDASGATVWRASYEPFGATASLTGPASLDARFPGQWFQLESGLAYNWNRHYDPSTGRYTQADPLGLPDGPSAYGYAGQSPLMNVDPTGQFVPAVVVGAIEGTAALCARYPTLCLTAASAARRLMVSLIKSRSIIDGECPPGGCGPCKIKNGDIVPVGTIAYRPLDTPDRPQHGISGSHYNLFRANQNPYNCKCFWQKLGAVEPSKLPIGAIPIDDFIP